MWVWCLWCKRWLGRETACTVLPGGTLWPVGVAICMRCCSHIWHKAVSTPPPGG